MTEFKNYKFMFDTNIFNHIIDNKIEINNFPQSFLYFITHIQKDEINQTKNEKRKTALLELFKQVDHQEVPTESAIVGISRIGLCKIGDENNLYSKMKAALDKIKKKYNNIQDALIAESCIKNNFILVTDDNDLMKVAKNFGGKVKSLKDFLRIKNKI